MAAPTLQGGNLVGSIASPLTNATFNGTASTLDYITSSNPNNYSFFSDVVQRGTSLIYTVSDPFSNKIATYTLPMLGTSNAIEYVSKDNGSGPSTGIYNFVAPGDYRSNTSYSGIQNYGTNGNDVVYGLLGATQNNNLSGGAGDDTLVGGGDGVSVLSGGSGKNILIGGTGVNRYKIEAADNGTNTITANGSNNIIQVLLTNTSFDWNFERVGDDAVGWIADVDGNTTNLIIKKQFTTNPIDSLVIYVNGFATDGTSYTSIGFLDPGVGVYTGAAQGFIGDSVSNSFNLGSTTRSTVRVFGNDGDDILYGAPIATREFFNGGNGLDKIIYTEALNKFTVAVSSKITVASSGKVIDYATVKHASKANPDALTNVERIQFSDTMLALDIGKDQTGGSAYMLYKAAFNRTPDVGGLGYWISKMDAGTSYSSVAQSFVNSAEFQAAFGGSNPSVNTLVTKLYNNVLNRTPDAGGLAFWQDKLNTGWSTADVLGFFSTSGENVTNVTPLIAKGISYTQFVG
jgi:hypothetical protein